MDGQSPTGHLLSAKDVAELVGMSRQWVGWQVKAGRLRCVRVGNRMKFRPEWVDQFLASRPSDAKGGAA